MALWTPNDLVESFVKSHSGPIFDFDNANKDALATQQDSTLNLQLDSRPGSASTITGFLAHAVYTDVSLVRLSPAAFRTAAASFAAISAPSSSRSPLLVLVPAANIEGASNISSSSSLTLVPALADILAGVACLDAHPIKSFDPSIIFADPSKSAAGLVDAFNSASNFIASGKDVVLVYDSLHSGREARLTPAPVLAPISSKQPQQNNNVVGEKPFTYTGSPSATHVLILPASADAHTARTVVEALEPAQVPVGVLTINLLRPWSDQDFTSALPDTVRSLHVYSENQNDFGPGALFADVLSASIALPKPARVYALANKASTTSLSDWADIISNLLGSQVDLAQSGILDKASSNPLPKLALFWSQDDSSSAQLAPAIAHTLSRAVAERLSIDHTTQLRLASWYDNYAGSGVGVANSALLLASSPATSRIDTYPVHALVQSQTPSLLFISDPAAYINTDYDPLKTSTLSNDTNIVFSTSWTPQEVYTKLASHPDAPKILANNRAYVLDADGIVRARRDADPKDLIERNVVEQVAFWLLYFGLDAPETESTVAQLMYRTLTDSLASNDQALQLVDQVKKLLLVVPDSKSLPADAIPQDVEPVDLPSSIQFNSTSPNPYKSFPEPLPYTKPVWHKAAQSLMFPNAFEHANDNRPDLSEENFILTVTENRRLTPSDYDRNVFHMELSTKGTGLKYAVGEALGIHGWNDEKEVLELIDYLNWGAPDSIVSFPARQDPENKIETRTLFQTLQQNLDIFGKPPKSFYEVLSKAASDKDEAKTLRFVSSPEGNATLKKWTDIETFTYADLLRRFPSAKQGLGLQGLLNNVEHIKPRHYSIASAQNFVGDSVHLLIVTVDWKTPSGETRYGQCTRYLADLPVGAKVTVSVKPSVMKLPPRDDLPIIMAGLGTGAAPFRAFIQERSYRKSKGINVGPLIYYFGSRYSSKEYLYGEEIEAYMLDGIITHAGLAFSRDKGHHGVKKEYIQHKMQNDGKLLSDLFANKEAYFYLCGPTWPVPDVFEAIVNSLSEYESKAIVSAEFSDKPEEARKQIEDYVNDLKEDERYVLEVY